MQLRSRNKPIGFYSEKKISETEKNNTPVSNEIKRPLEMDELILNISYIISKQIKKPKSHITLRLDISKKVEKYLQIKYNITKRFQHIPSLLNENIRTTMPTNEQVYNEIILESFKIKFANEKKNKFTEDNKRIILTRGPQVVIEFKKKRIFKLNQNMRNMLNNI